MTEVDLFVSTQRIKVLTADTQVRRKCDILMRQVSLLGLAGMFLSLLESYSIRKCCSAPSFPWLQPGAWPMSETVLSVKPCHLH